MQQYREPVLIILAFLLAVCGSIGPHIGAATRPLTQFDLYSLLAIGFYLVAKIDRLK